MIKPFFGILLFSFLITNNSVAADTPLPVPPGPQPTPIMTVHWEGKIWNNVCLFYPSVIDCQTEQVIHDKIAVDIPIYENAGFLSGHWSESFNAGTHKFIAQITINQFSKNSEFSVFISLYELDGSWNPKKATANLFMKSLDQMLTIQVHGPTTKKYSDNKAYIPFFKIKPL